MPARADAFRSTVDPHLPHLRRYARALAGRQDAGDYAVACLLEDLLERRRRLPRGIPVRVGLYRRIAQALGALGLIEVAACRASERGGAASLPMVTSLPRHAFLLRALERFSDEDAARVLEIDTPRLQQLAEQGRCELADQSPTSVLIIQPDPFCVMQWEMTLDDLGHTVAAKARTHDEAILLAASQPPGLILTCTLLAGGGFAHPIINEIARSSGAPAIVGSAYPQFSLTGARPETPFVIGKMDPEPVFEAIIGQALFIKRHGLSNYQLPDADTTMKDFQEGFWVIISTVATRQFAYKIDKGYGLYDDFGSSLGAFMRHFDFNADVDIISMPQGRIACRSHAKVTLRKRPWTTARRFYEIIDTFYHELRYPKPEPVLPLARRDRW